MLLVLVVRREQLAGWIPARLEDNMTRILYPCAHLLQASLQGIGGEAECRPLTAGVGP